MFTINFWHGFSLGPGHAWGCGLAIENSESDEEDEVHLLVEWRAGREPRILQLPNRPVGLALASHSDAEPTLFVAYGSGRVAAFHGEGATTEMIEGPMQLGPLRELRTIGKSTFGVGMARQVYQRMAPGNWTPVDDGVRHVPTGILDVTGLNSIDGVDENELIAVGYDGEMWRGRQGQWSQIASPTNVLLNVVEVVNPDLAYVGGLLGILLRGHGDNWEVIEHDETAESFVTMAYFHDHLYLSDGETLFRLEEDDTLTALDIGDEARGVVAHLHADQDALWAFGPMLMTRTTDGETWVDADTNPPPTSES